MNKLDDDLNMLYWAISKKAADIENEEISAGLHNIMTVINAARDKIKEQDDLILSLKKIINLLED